MKSFSRSVPASLVGYVVLTLILTAGAAQSLSGSNTVFTDDIVDGTVKSIDIKSDAILGSRIRNGTITGADVADNNLSGADVNESTLSIKEAITKSQSFQCLTPPSGQNCVTLQVSMPKSGALFVSLDAETASLGTLRVKLDGEDFVAPMDFVAAGSHTIMVELHEASTGCGGASCGPSAASGTVRVLGVPAVVQ